MDREKVIKGLEQCKEGGSCDGCQYNINTSKCISLLHADALAMLKEQEAVEPKHYEATRYNGELFACGDCRHELELKPRFCPYCGKAVKWG